ncbi:MAG: ferrous iron transport protein A [Kiritimatiellae bacterium]|nr:ferrous iron transport protein A [Kiritimatiellia bacterium]
MGNEATSLRAGKRLSLADLREGETAEIIRIGGRGALRQRLLDMGLTRGTRIKVERYAPLRDPIELSVKGYLLALRVEEGRQIEVERLETGNSKLET